MVCENDPLCDDSVRFFKVLLDNKVAVDMQIMKYLPHGVLNFDVPNGLPQAKQFVQKCANSINAMFLRKSENKRKKQLRSSMLISEKNI